MSRVLHWLSPGDPGQRTGGYIYNDRMVTALQARGWAVEVHALPGAWPWPCGADLQAGLARVASIPRGEPVVADGLLWPGLGAGREVVAEAHPVVVLVHSLLDKEGGGDPNQLLRLEDAALSEADAWIATSPATGRLVRSRLGASGPDGAVVCPGTDPAPRAAGSSGHQLLCVATVTPRKGIRLLVQAVARLKDPDWRLDIVGSTQRAPAYVDLVRQDIDAAGLSHRIHLLGEQSGAELQALYQQADVLVHAAHFEAFGMGLAEAIARAIPVVSTPAGALEVIPSGAVRAVPEGDASALATALDTVLCSRAVQEQMASAAASADLMNWPDTAACFESALEGLL